MFDCSLGVKKDVNMVEMSSYYVLGVVGWCLGAYPEVHKTWMCHVHTFLHTVPPLQQLYSSHALHHATTPYLYSIYTALYSAVELYSSTAALQYTDSTPSL